MADKPDFSKMSVGDLRTLADNLQIENSAKLKKGELIAAIEMSAATTMSADKEAPVVSIPSVVVASKETAEGNDSSDGSDRRGRRPRKPSA